MSKMEDTAIFSIFKLLQLSRGLFNFATNLVSRSTSNVQDQRVKG